MGPKSDSLDTPMKPSPTFASTPASSSKPNTPGSEKRKRDEASVGGESVAATKQTPRRKAAEEKVLNPGDAQNPRSFIDCYEIEATIAAYVGYEDTTALRMLVSSNVFPPFFTRFSRPWSKGLQRTGVLEQVRDVHLKRGASSANFPTKQLSDLDKNRVDDKPSYAEKEKSSRNRYAAHILIYMVTYFRDLANRQGASVKIEPDKVKKMHDILKTREKNISQMPDLTGHTTIKLPTLEPALEEESQLEPYNRAWQLLKYFQSCVAYPKKFADRFAGMNWKKGAVISQQYVPNWMRPKSALPPRPVAVVEALPAIVYDLKWESSAKNQQTLKQHWGENEMGPNDIGGELVGHGDPRVDGAQEYRDTVRLQFNAQELMIQIAGITMDVPIAGKDDFRTFNLITGDWNAVKACLESSFPKGHDRTDHVKVTVRFRPYEGEPEDIFESSEQPPKSLLLRAEVNTTKR